MGITLAQIQNTMKIQDLAAQDMTPTVRLVAGPGSGKSLVIEGRVLHLLQMNINPTTIFAVSFTRAAANDLRERIVAHCTVNHQPSVSAVRVSTLHSLALFILRQTGNLNIYPTNPEILDDWELKYIFDAELSNLQGVSPSRCEGIRRDHEAFWSTGAWGGHLFQLQHPSLSRNVEHSKRTLPQGLNYTAVSCPEK